MGGKKKRSMKQITKAQKKTGKKEKQVAKPSGEKKGVPRLIPPKLKDDALESELKKIKVITPYSIATRFDLNLSTARVFLNDLERKGLIELVSRSRNLRIYKPAG